MTQDDDRDCPEHVWQLVAYDLIPGESMLEYECTRCGATSWERANRPSGGGQKG
ncbi:hypothetical protein ACFT5B_06915 [Luteimicrobium sp. NPDC057192]|uniref:hypothetical protein n=1 Tax=Luteimicrobium sp. NPDC057192 TaxID=3346042 RepID=UPI00363E2E94